MSDKQKAANELATLAAKAAKEAEGHAAAAAAWLAVSKVAEAIARPMMVEIRLDGTQADVVRNARKRKVGR